MSELKSSLLDGIAEEPREHYTFCLKAVEALPVEKIYMRLMKKRMLASLVCGILLICFGFGLGRFVIGLGVGILIISLAVHIRNYCAYKKLFEKSRSEYETKVYDYTLYGDFMIVWISSDTAIRQMKIPLSSIRKSRLVGNILVMEIEGQLFPVKKDALVENSFFLGLCATVK